MTSADAANALDLLDTAQFHRRHIGPSASDEARMLARIGVASRDALIDETIPASIRISSRVEYFAGSRWPETRATRSS